MQHKPFLLPIVLLMPLFLTACGRKDKSDTSSKIADSITYKTVHFEKTLGNCKHPDSGCARISIDYPEIQKAPAEAAKEAINRFIQNTILKSSFSGKTAPGMEVLMTEFIDEYKDVVSNFPNYSNSWTDEKEMKVLYSDADVASFSLSEQAYTGGAHGLSTVLYYNFDLQNGRQLTLADLFVPGYEEELTRIGETQFRKMKQLSAGETLSSAGFWFGNDRFKLNDNFAITKAGIAFYYNNYEIAPYAMGPTELLLTYQDLKTIIPEKGALRKFIQN